MIHTETMQATHQMDIKIALHTRNSNTLLPAENTKLVAFIKFKGSDELTRMKKLDLS